MGMYTALHFDCEIKNGTSKDILNILSYMVGDHDNQPEELPNHELFNCNRWRFMLQCDSYYFDADTNSTLRYDKISKGYFLCIKSNFKNYDSEIEKFIAWIHQYLEGVQGKFLGFYMYEEDEKPTLIYKETY